MVTRKHAGEELIDASGERQSSEESAPVFLMCCADEAHITPLQPGSGGTVSLVVQPSKMHARKEVQLSHHNNNMQSTTELWNIRLNKSSIDTG